MQEEDRPLGIKIIFWLFLASGILGLLISLFSSDDTVRNSIVNSDVLSFIGGFFNNVVFLRGLLVVYSAFALWLSSGISSLKKVTWYFLLFFTFLPIILYLIVLGVLYKNNVSLEGIQMIAVIFRIVISFCWFVYIFSVGDYFEN